MIDALLLALGEQLELVTMQQYNFIYSDDELGEPDLFIITPDEKGYPIQHQYGCVSCNQFHVTGFLTAWNGPIARELSDMLGCVYAARDEINARFGIGAETVLGEALLLLRSGAYIACNNCD